MSISGINASKNVSAVQMVKQEPVDAISKSIENEISDVQRQRQQVSKQDLSADEKMKKRRELQQEISRLNNQLRQRQAETRRKQNQEEAAKERDTENVKADDEKKVQLSTSKKDETKEKETESKTVEMQDAKKEQGTEQKVVSAETVVSQSRLQKVVVSGIRNDIRILKGEIKQDKARGENVDDKKKQLEKNRNRLHRASSGELTGKAQKDSNDIKVSNTNYSKEKNNIERQNFNISFS
ncbi:MAG: FlxA-like family protein [Clostridium sp.]|nr:FlxA-like family protein [Clostridium sp.]MCM1459159.1 FlxA-like family protein [Bacteroides sp.]